MNSIDPGSRRDTRQKWLPCVRRGVGGPHFQRLGISRARLHSGREGKLEIRQSRHSDSGAKGASGRILFPPRHRHFYFAHAYEGQGGSVELLERFERGGGFLYDLEQIKDSSGAQLVTGGAGYLAGMCAATACLDIWKQRHCERTGSYRVPNQFASCAELSAYARSLLAAHIPIPRILVIGHRGKSGSGVTHLLDELGLGYDRSLNYPRKDRSKRTAARVRHRV